MATNKFITFWQFIQGQKIEIPIIQRDYAQGRNGKEKLREKFLKDLKHALDNTDSDTKLKLDFVYGTLENEKLQPLDGQQRLTTLWLLHWYIAYKAGKLDENKEVFKRFTYETRTSSREFCHKLSEFSDPTSNENIVSHIQNQTWFYSIWKQDPTIQAMLNMLNMLNMLRRDDGKEKLFEKNFENYWNKLTSENCPIIFYYMPLNELKLSDDLYIKMNARGKPLTSFENFKADLVGFIKSRNDEKDNIKSWQSFDLQNFEAKIDNTWTDIFWKYKSDDYKIDAIYFTFLNRYFLNKLIASKDTDGKYLLTQNRIESNELFKYLYGESGNDTKVKYDGFDIYKSDDLLKLNNEFFENLRITLDNLSGSENLINNVLLPKWELNSIFRFIPEYVKNAPNDHTEPKYIPSEITQPQRVVFYAICCYFENGQYDEISFKQWMRVVWNIVENANITNTESMIGAIRLITDLSKNAHNIYIHLKDRDISNDFAKDQIEEEKEKARKIIEDPTWEDKIIEAENWSFFKGAIRFLYKNEDDIVDWNKFDDRLIKSNLYFDEKGVKLEYRKDAFLLRALISYFTLWGQFWGIVYDNEYKTWKSILIDKKWIRPVSNLLDENSNEIFNCTKESKMISSESHNRVIEDLVCSSLLANIDDGCKLNWRSDYGKHALYPPKANANWKKYIVGDLRNKVFFDLTEQNIISTNQKISGLAYFWGWEIYFTNNQNGKKYQWWHKLKIQSESGEWKDVDGVDLNNLREHLQKQN
jgi:Protein of unknown function DUF262